MAPFLDDQPDAPAEALYLRFRSFPGFNTRPVSWADAPMSVRGACETFRSVYRICGYWCARMTPRWPAAYHAAPRLVHDCDPQADIVIRLPVAPASHGDEVE